MGTNNITSRINSLCEQHNVTVFRLREILTIPKSSYYKMLNEQSEWRLEYLIRIADYFKVSLDYLIKGELPCDIDYKKLEEEKRELKEENEQLRTFVDRYTELLPQVKDLKKGKHKRK